MIYIFKAEYRLVNEGGTTFITRTAGTPVCPVCGGELYQIGWRRRGYIDADGEKRGVYIRRLRCAGCGKIHHELPDLLVPYKRHCAETIENAITGNDDKCICEQSTIRRIKRWWQRMSDYFTNILYSAAARTEVKPPESPTFRDKIRAAVNSNYWTFPGQLPVVPTGGTFQPVRQ